MNARPLLWALVAVGLGACPRERTATTDRSELLVGAPEVRHHTPAAPAATRDGGPAHRAIEQNLPEEATKQFATLEEMERSPRWSNFGLLIRSQVAKLYARTTGTASRKAPHDISITQYFIRGLPEVYGVGYVAWCGGAQTGPLAYVESHLLVAREGGALALLAAHTPSCGSVGERTVYFSDLIADGKDELIEIYIEDTAVGDDVQEIRVFTQTPKGLRRVAALRSSSSVKYFHHEFRKTESGKRDIVTTHIEAEKVLARLRKRPCWMYRYFEVETTYRYKPETAQFVSKGTVRRRISQNAALDLTGSEAPEGSCGG